MYCKLLTKIFIQIALSHPSYNDLPILAGQGVAALEVLEQMDNLGVEPDAIVIPVGGGGLLAGMVTVIQHLKPNIKIIVSLFDALEQAICNTIPCRECDQCKLVSSIVTPYSLPGIEILLPTVGGVIWLTFLSYRNKLIVYTLIFLGITGYVGRVSIQKQNITSFLLSEICFWSPPNRVLMAQSEWMLQYPVVLVMQLL